LGSGLSPRQERAIKEIADIERTDEVLSGLVGQGIDDIKNLIDLTAVIPTNMEELDHLVRGYLMRGVMFTFFYEEQYYLEAMVDYMIKKSGTPFYSPSLQFWNIDKFIGLLSMLKLCDVELINKIGHWPKTDDKKLRKKVDQSVKDGKWPKNAFLVYYFGDPVITARLSFEYLAWHHKASVLFKEYFNEGFIRSISNSHKGLKHGYHLFEIPEKDWREGIGSQAEGMSVDNAKRFLEDGWQFMGWEGLQLLVTFPYYPLLMNTVSALNLILPGLETRHDLSGEFFSVPSASFDKKEAELKFHSKEIHQQSDLYGVGLVRYLGPLKKFI